MPRVEKSGPAVDAKGKIAPLMDIPADDINGYVILVVNSADQLSVATNTCCGPHAAEICHAAADHFDTSPEWAEHPS